MDQGFDLGPFFWFETLEIASFEVSAFQIEEMKQPRMMR